MKYYSAISTGVLKHDWFNIIRPPFPPINNDEVQPDCFCARMNYFGQGGVGGGGYSGAKSALLLSCVVVINSYTYSVLTTPRHCGICALLQRMPHSQGVTWAQTNRKKILLQNVHKRTHTYVHFLISQQLLGYGFFTLTQSCITLS